MELKVCLARSSNRGCRQVSKIWFLLTAVVVNHIIWICIRSAGKLDWKSKNSLLGAGLSTFYWISVFCVIKRYYIKHQHTLSLSKWVTWCYCIMGSCGECSTSLLLQVFTGFSYTHTWRDGLNTEDLCCGWVQSFDSQAVKYLFFPTCDWSIADLILRLEGNGAKRNLKSCSANLTLSRQ